MLPITGSLSTIKLFTLLVRFNSGIVLIYISSQQVHYFIKIYSADTSFINYCYKMPFFRMLPLTRSLPTIELFTLLVGFNTGIIIFY